MFFIHAVSTWDELELNRTLMMMFVKWMTIACEPHSFRAIETFRIIYIECMYELHGACVCCCTNQPSGIISPSTNSMAAMHFELKRNETNCSSAYMRVHLSVCICLPIYKQELRIEGEREVQKNRISYFNLVMPLNFVTILATLTWFTRFTDINHCLS